MANRGPDAAELHVLPTLWFRNQWSWHGLANRPVLQQVAGAAAMGVVKAVDPKLGERYLYCADDAPLLFTENETNTQRIFGIPNRTPYVKDGNNCVVHGQTDAVNPGKAGTKVAAHYRVTVEPGGEQMLQLRLCDIAPRGLSAEQRQTGDVVRQELRRAVAGPPKRGR